MSTTNPILLIQNVVISLALRLKHGARFFQDLQRNKTKTPQTLVDFFQDLRTAINYKYISNASPTSTSLSAI